MTPPQGHGRRERIDALAAEAWGLDPGARDAYLRRECGDDDELRADVEALLVAGDEAVVEPATAEALDPGRWEIPSAPQRVGPYVVEREIARGGMGVVLRARDARLGRIVALKALPAEYARHPGALARFRREARALGAIAHPNVAVLHDLQQHAGLAYLVMEMVDGPTLRERVRRGPVPVPEALSIGAQVAAALAAAHERGIVHRDLKPENVKLTARGLVKVLDFGIAKLAATPAAAEDPTPSPPAAADDAALTQRGAFIGTPGYGAPEQVRGETVDARADLFGLGCILFECLAGVPAFPGRTPAERGHAVLSSAPDWGALPDALPREAAALVHACLSKSPAHRPASAEEVQHALERALAARSWEPRAGAPGEPAGNLPAPLTSFVGRAAEVARVRQALARARLVTLTGVGGCGKTRVALEAARSLGAAPSGGTWLAELAPLADPSAVPATVASVLGVRADAGADAWDALARHLRARDALLVLDNCEHLLEAAGRLAEHLLRAAPGLRILATSREPLGVPGEQILVVPSLTLPPENASVAAAAESEAVALFVERARLASPDFRLDAATAPLVVLACRRLDGIPLALELAAARVRHVPLEELAQRLVDRFGLLTGGPRGALPRHQALQATMEWSHDLLSPAERALYRRLAAFAGGFAQREAQLACAGDGLTADEIPELLAHLADKSLLADDQRAGRRRMLETVRQHAQAKLVASGEAEAVRRRHAETYLALAEESLPRLDGPEQAECLARLEADRDNFRAALDWLASRPDGAAAEMRLAVALWSAWDASGARAEARARLAHAVGRADDAVPKALLTSALRGLGWFSRNAGDTEGARRAFERALALDREGGSRWAVAAAMLNLGNLALDENDEAEARARFGEALAEFRASGHERGTAVTLNNLGLLDLTTGDLDAARRAFDEARAILESAGDARALAGIEQNVALLEAAAGRFALAQDIARRAVAVARETGDRPAAAAALAAQGVVELQAGDVRAARAHLEEALPALREAESAISELADALRSLAVARARDGDPAGALEAIREALDLPRQRQEAGPLAETARAFALILLACQAAGPAARLLGASLLAAERLSPGARLRPAWASAVRRLRVALGDERLGKLMREGARVPLEEALERAEADVFG